MPMFKAIFRFLVTLGAASIVIFVAMRAVPGNPARVMLGVNATDAAVAELSTQLGLDRPLLTQYGSWTGDLLRGDLGISLVSKTNITAVVLDRAQVSLLLVGTALVAALAVAIPLGIISARRKRTVGLDIAVQLGIAVPSFLMGMLLIAFVALRLDWFPANGWVPPNAGFGRFLSHLVLPVISLAAVQAAMLTRYVRTAIIDVIDKDFMRTARAIGASPAQAMWRHGLRNAALPVLTVMGVQLTTLVVGAVVIESVFVIPGLGTYLLKAVSARDVTTVQSIIMLLVAFTLTINFLVEMAYRLIDPRLGVHR
ncbi:MAG: ABC transporter permease [Corynebacterium sp.]|nr:ABC transporter permease [Corynebacterium sp.]